VSWRAAGDIVRAAAAKLFCSDCGCEARQRFSGENQLFRGQPTCLLENAEFKEAKCHSSQRRCMSTVQTSNSAMSELSFPHWSFSITGAALDEPGTWSSQANGRIPVHCTGSWLGRIGQESRQLHLNIQADERTMLAT